MRCKRIGFVALVTWLVLLGNDRLARALVPRKDPPVPQRVALADLVVVGEVTALDDKAVDADPPLPVPGAKKVSYQIAVVRVSDVLVGEKNLREVRIGLVAPPAEKEGTRFQRWPSVKLAVEQKACFFLTKHCQESFYLVPAFSDVVDKKSNTFDKELALAQRCAQLLSDPKAGLQSKDAEDRLLTAATLIFRYRTPKEVYTGDPKTEPIAADESKLILDALAASAWDKTDGEIRGQALFFRLGLTPEDGWSPPGDFKEVPAAARKWLQDKAATYRIQRFVPEVQMPKGK